MASVSLPVRRGQVDILRSVGSRTKAFLVKSEGDMYICRHIDILSNISDAFDPNSKKVLPLGASSHEVSIYSRSQY